MKFDDIFKKVYLESIIKESAEDDEDMHGDMDDDGYKSGKDEGIKEIDSKSGFRFGVDNFGRYYMTDKDGLWKDMKIEPKTKTQLDVQKIFDQKVKELMEENTCCEDVDDSKINVVLSKNLDGKDYFLGSDGQDNYYFAEYSPDGWRQIGGVSSSLEAENMFDRMVKNAHRPWGKDDEDDDDNWDEDDDWELERQGIFPSRRDDW